MSGLLAVLAAVSQLVSAGPAIAGDAVVWGERSRAGGLRVVARDAGRTRVLRRYAAPRRKDVELGFSGLPGGLSASDRWVAYGIDRGRCVGVGTDAVGCELNMRAVGSHDGGPFRPLVPACRSAAYVSTSSDGDGVAIGQDAGDCDGSVRTRVWLKEGDAAPRLVFEAPADVSLRQVELAGPWIAWSTRDTDITVAERATGRVVARYRPRDFSGGRTVMAFALDAAGNVAALSGRQPRCWYRCVAVRNVAGGPARELSRRASDLTVALAGGRVAFVRTPRRGDGHVVVMDLDGTDRRRFDRFTGRRGHGGEVVLTADRVAWAAVRDPYGRSPRGEVRAARLGP